MPWNFGEAVEQLGSFSVRANAPQFISVRDVGFAGLDRAPSYVELLTCLEMAKQAMELPQESKMGTVGQR
jgi:hypothetical protein